jgi:uncharacterized phage-associated protein
MADVRDVAAYILEKRGPMTAIKLQKLCYYSHAWHLVWEDKPLFTSRIEAWANGPVVIGLYRQHRGQFSLAAGDIDGDTARLADGEKTSIDSVLDFYGAMTAHQLSELTHREPPWRDARAEAGLAPMDRGTAVIPDSSIYEYYLALATAEGGDR